MLMTPAADITGCRHIAFSARCRRRCFSLYAYSTHAIIIAADADADTRMFADCR